MHATSGEDNANLTAFFWLSLREGSKNVMSLMAALVDGANIPRRTRTRRFISGPEVSLP